MTLIMGLIHVVASTICFFMFSDEILAVMASISFALVIILCNQNMLTAELKNEMRRIDAQYDEEEDDDEDGS